MYVVMWRDYNWGEHWNSKVFYLAEDARDEVDRRIRMAFDEIRFYEVVEQPSMGKKSPPEPEYNIILGEN